MSAQKVERALARLASPGSVLARDRDGVRYGVFPNGDRRRRPVARLAAPEVRALASAGALDGSDDTGFVLSAAGRTRVRRESAAESEAYLAQHAPLETRAFISASGAIGDVRAVVSNAAIRRLAQLRDANGAPWLSAAEVSAAERLHADWERGQAGLTRGSDWSAPPMGSTPRGPGNAQEAALAARCDAGRRVADALARLAPPLRRIVESACLHEQGLEAIERAHGWPARSGKLALKLGLAQLAAGFSER